AAAMGGASADHPVRHPQRLRIGLPVDASRGDDRPARPGRGRSAGGPAAAARAWGPHLGGLCGHVRERVGSPCQRDGRGSKRAVISQRVWRILAPAAVGLVFLGLWEAGVRGTGVPAYILPAPSAVARSLWVDGPSLLGS